MGDGGTPDITLLEAWCAGDQTAGQWLFDRHADAIARFFENKVRSGAEDLIQATFLRMIEGRGRFRHSGSFRAFAFGIARNVLRGHLRELARGREVDPRVDSMAELAPGPSTVAAQRQEHRLMLEGLRHLSIEDQLLLELYYWEELKSHEIGEILEIPGPSTRRRIFDARRRLDEQMARLASSPELLASTTHGLDSWVAEIRAELGNRGRGRSD